MVATIRSPNADRQDALGRVPYPPVRLSRYTFATGSGAATANRNSLQAAVTKAIAARTWLVNDLPAGYYDLALQGSVSPYYSLHTHCVDIGDGTIGFVFVGSRAAIFRLGPDQISGSTQHCYIFGGRNHKGFRFSGRYDGGSLQQSGWSGGYDQDFSGVVKLYATAAGWGNEDCVFDGGFIENCFGNPISAGYNDAGDRRASKSVTIRNFGFKRIGEGPQLQDTLRQRIHDCHIDNSDATMKGDFFEVARAQWFEVVRCTTYGARPVTPVGGAVDPGGSVAGVVKDCSFVGGTTGVDAGYSNGANVTVHLENTTFVDMDSLVDVRENTLVTLKDCHVKDVGGVSVPSVRVGVAGNGGSSVRGATLVVDGGKFDGCGEIFVTQNATLKMVNRPVIINALADAIRCVGSASNTTKIPTLDLDVDVLYPAQHGLHVDGNGHSGYAPRGRVRGTFQGATAGLAAGQQRRNFASSNVGSFGQLDIDVTIPEAVQSYLNTFEFVGAKVSDDPDYDPGDYPAESNPLYRIGSKGQRVLFRGVAATKTFTNAAWWQLTTSTFTLNTKSSILMEHLGSGVWREVERWVMA